MINLKNTIGTRKIILLLLVVLVLPLVLAANDPGHDTLYMEENESAEIGGDFNVSDNLTVKGGNSFLQSYLDIYTDGTTINTPSINTIAGTNTYLAIDAPGDIFINRYANDGTVYLGHTGDTVNINITGALFFGGNNELDIAQAGGAASSDLYWGDKLLCDASESGCGWAAGTSSGNCSADQSCLNILYDSNVSELLDDTTIGNCSGDQSCSGILYDSNASDFTTPGDCGGDQFVQNTTSGGVECAAPSLATAGGWTDSGTTVSLTTSTDNVSANTLHIDNTNDRVGIGTATPETELHVEGDITLGGTNFYFEDSTSGGDASLIRTIHFNNNDNLMYNDTSNTYTFSGDGTDYMTIDTGNVIAIGDINTTSGDICIESGNCLSTMSGADGNNYTTSISFNETGSTIQLNLEMVGRSNLTATFTDSYAADTTIGNCSVDQSCSGILYDTNASDFMAAGTDNWLNETGDTATGNFTFGSTALHIDDTNDRIGIGTATPKEKLDVSGNTNVTGTMYANTISLTGACCGTGIDMNNENLVGVGQFDINDPGGHEGFGWSTTGAEVYVAPLDDSNADGYMQFVNDGGIAFEGVTDGTTDMIIDTNHNIGIGTISPNATLHVDGDINATGDVCEESSGNCLSTMGSGSMDDWDLYTDGTERDSITNAEDVGFDSGTGINVGWDGSRDVTFAFDCSDVTDTAGDHLTCDGSENIIVSDDWYNSSSDVIGGFSGCSTADQYLAGDGSCYAEYDAGDDLIDDITEWQGQCTDCVEVGDIGDILTANEITDIYVFTAGDTMTGGLTVGDSSGENLIVGDTNCDAAGCNIEIEDGSLCIGAGGCSASATEGTLIAAGDINTSGGDICIQGGNCLSDMGSGSGSMDDWDLYTDGTERDSITNAEDVGFDSGTGINVGWDGSRDVTFAFDCSDVDGEHIICDGEMINVSDDWYNSASDVTGGFSGCSTADQYLAGDGSCYAEYDAGDDLIDDITEWQGQCTGCVDSGDLDTDYEEETHCTDHDGNYLSCDGDELDVDASGVCGVCTYDNYGDWDLYDDGAEVFSVTSAANVGFDGNEGISVVWDGSRDIGITFDCTEIDDALSIRCAGEDIEAYALSASDGSPDQVVYVNSSGNVDITGNVDMDGDLTVRGGDITGAGNAILDIGEATASDFTFYDTTDASEYVEFNCRDSDSDSLCQFNTGLYVSSGITYIQNSLRARGGIQDDSLGYLDLIDDVNITGDLKVQGGDITGPSGDFIDLGEATAGYIEFQGIGGSDDTDLRIDLDGTYPVIDSPTDGNLGFAETVLVLNAADLRVYSAGNDKYIELTHDDTNAYIQSPVGDGDIYISPGDGDVVIQLG